MADRDRVIALLPTGIPLTMVSALGALFGAALPGGGFGGSTGYDTAATIQLPDGMPVETAAGHLIAAAELLAEAAPTPVEVEPIDVGHTLNRMEFPDDGGLTVTTGAVGEADLQAREFVLRIIAAFAPYFEENPAAKNYVEYMAYHPDTGERWTLTVRKPRGRTEHQLRQDAEAERDTAREELAELRRYIEEHVRPQGNRYCSGLDVQ